MNGENVNVVSPLLPPEGEGVIGQNPEAADPAVEAEVKDEPADAAPVKPDTSMIKLLTEDLWENDSRIIEDTLVKLANLCCQDAVGIAQRTANVTLCIRAGGQLWCWGRGLLGELGDDLSEDSLVPVRAGNA